MAAHRFAVIFDLDGVIVDTNPYHRKAMILFCEQHRSEIIPVDENILRTRVFGLPSRASMPELFLERLELSRIDELSAEKDAIFRSLISGSIRPLAGLSELLEELARLGVPLAVASSAPAANIELLLAETHFRSYFSVVLNELSVSAGKPAPDIYLRAAELIGCAPERCVVFEDSIAGLTAARAAGCCVIGIATTHTSDELAPLADLVESDFSGLRAVSLESLVEAKRTMESRLRQQ